MFLVLVDMIRWFRVIGLHHAAHGVGNVRLRGVRFACAARKACCQLRAVWPAPSLLGPSSDSPRCLLILPDGPLSC